MGIFHEFTPELAYCILCVAVEDAPEQRKRNNEDLERQEKARMEKEDYIKAKGMEKAKKELVEAYMFYDMYFSDACWKGNPTAVTAKLKKLDSDNKKRDALKANVSIRVK